jgi:site-specific DNA-methyltransferase (cytosine-N4-specific)
MTISDKIAALAYQTKLGSMFIGKAEDVLKSKLTSRLKGKVQLIFTSPPFPLNRKKSYGNLQGDAYINWLEEMSVLLCNYLTEDGSIVMEVGNAWEKGAPVMSTLALKSLLAFQEKANLHLCQQFVCYNPARLPGPAQWVTVERVRVKDAFTHVWWMSPSYRPKADNRRVLKKYSASMLQLLRSKKYNAGRRPSEHSIGKTSFLRDNRGAIPSNVLTLSNTRTNDPYQLYCRANGFAMHPARMQIELADFFVRFLTDPGDIVMDPFAGSNTTGAAAEGLKRKWISIEPEDEYVRASQGRFASS